MGILSRMSKSPKSFSFFFVFFPISYPFSTDGLYLSPDFQLRSSYSGSSKETAASSIIIETESLTTVPRSRSPPIFFIDLSLWIIMPVLISFLSGQLWMLDSLGTEVLEAVSKHQLHLEILRDQQWSFRRFTYGNLVTTFTSSKWGSLGIFPVTNATVRPHCHQSEVLTKSFNR